MKVFISWSGERSRAVAEVFRGWIPSVLQAVRPYFSPDDVEKGSRWSSEIAKELEASRVGLLVITPENQEATWLLFEAGALAKSVERSKVCPILFSGMDPTDVKGPLVQFQAAQFSKEEMKRVTKMMNGELADAALAPDVLDQVFEMWWPKLNEKVQAALSSEDRSDREPRRSDRDILEEVLALTRRLARDRERRPEPDHPVWEDLLISAVELARIAIARGPDADTTNAIKRLIRPLDYLAQREVRRGASPSRLPARHLVKELEAILEIELNAKVPPDSPAGTTSSAGPDLDDDIPF